MKLLPSRPHAELPQQCTSPLCNTAQVVVHAETTDAVLLMTSLPGTVVMGVALNTPV